MADVGRAREPRGGWKGETDLEPGQQDYGWRGSGFTGARGLESVRSGEPGAQAGRRGQRQMGEEDLSGWLLDLNPVPQPSGNCYPPGAALGEIPLTALGMAQ